jgi:hypothetical protein
MKMLKLIITGCGRSGTKYISGLLTKAGVLCGHEVVFSEQMARTGQFQERPDGMHAEASWLAAGVIDRLDESVKIVHQVRNPVRVIRSMSGVRSFIRHSDFCTFIYGKLGGLKKSKVVKRDDRYLDMCMEFWVRWNKLAEDASYRTFRVEDVNLELASELCNHVRETKAEDVYLALEQTPTTTNTRDRDESVTWGSLPSGEYKDKLFDVAVRYGYSLDDLKRA